MKNKITIKSEHEKAMRNFDELCIGVKNMKNKIKIRFSDLNWQIKVGVVGGWISVIAFSSGVITGFFGV